MDLRYPAGTQLQVVGKMVTIMFFTDSDAQAFFDWLVWLDKTPKPVSLDIQESRDVKQ